MIIGMLIFPDMTQLDFTGPYEVFGQVPGAEIKVISTSMEPVAARGGLRFLPDTTLDNAPQLDVLFVAGGPGVSAAMEDAKVLEFLRRQAVKAKFVTSVCTGSLLLGAAGLLKGYRATAHWMSLDLLPYFGAITLPDRVVIDRNRITGGGVTSGIDCALVIAGELVGSDAAKKIQLMIEYNPAPPFDCGHPSKADPALVESVRNAMAPMQAARREQAERIAKQYC
jgi:cyclohexyl-isocyanide hydratase